MKKKLLLFAGGIIMLFFVVGFLSRKSDQNSLNEDFIQVSEDEEKNIFLSLRYEDCSEGCKSFENEMDKLIYCQKVCNISPAQNAAISNSETCSTKEGIKKDYCWENKAFSRKSIELCERITEIRIKKICKRNIMKYFIEGVAPKVKEE